MRKIIIASMAAAAFSLAACSEKAQEETSEAAGDKIADETKKAEANDKK
jgi:hypothetical protein